MIRSKLRILKKKMIKMIETDNLFPQTFIRVSDDGRSCLYFPRDSALAINLKNRLRPYPIPTKRDKFLGNIFKQLEALEKKENRNAFLNNFLPQIIRGDFKNLWLRRNCERSIPSLSRGFKGTIGGETQEERKSLKRKSLDDDYLKKSEDAGGFKRLVDECNGTAEQKIYTQASYLDKQANWETDWKDTAPPPPRKCRLSCPLPPEPHWPEIDVTPPSLPQSAPGKKLEYYSVKKLETSLKPHKSVVLSPQVKKPGKQKKNSPAAHQSKGHTVPAPAPEAPKMRALVFQPEGLTLDYWAVDAPTRIHKDEVLVQVTYSGVSGMDMLITEGKISCGSQPVILGHEISGKVYACGKDVHHVQPGDNVAVNPFTACAVCRYCVRGQFSSCLNEGMNHALGVSKDGGWAEYVIVNRTQVYKIPLQVGLDQAALIHPLSCVLSAMSKMNISPEVEVLIQGLGLAGSLWASVLHAGGHRNVHVTEKNEKKREQFQNMNLGYPFILPEDLGKFTADAVIECSGNTATIERSFKNLNPGGQLCFFVKPSPMTEIRCIPYDIVSKEIKILGASGNSFCFSKAIDLAASLGYRYLDFQKLGVRVFDLEEYREAFLLKKSGDVGKIMFKFDS